MRRLGLGLRRWTADANARTPTPTPASAREELLLHLLHRRSLSLSLSLSLPLSTLPLPLSNLPTLLPTKASNANTQPKTHSSRGLLLRHQRRIPPSYSNSYPSDTVNRSQVRRKRTRIRRIRMSILVLSILGILGIPHSELLLLRSSSQRTRWST